MDDIQVNFTKLSSAAGLAVADLPRLFSQRKALCKGRRYIAGRDHERAADAAQRTASCLVGVLCGYDRAGGDQSPVVLFQLVFTGLVCFWTGLCLLDAGHAGGLAGI